MDPIQNPIQPVNPNPAPESPYVPQETSFSNQAPVPTQNTFQEQSLIGVPKSRGSKVLFFILGLLMIILLILGAGSAVVYAIAYEKIKLEKNPELQQKISMFVQSLPFAPKTPKYIFAKSILAHAEVTKETFDASLAMDSEDLAKSLGLSAIDGSAKGAIDYTDPKNIKLSLDLWVTKDFNLELLKKDALLYFKINKLPSLFLSILGLGGGNFDPIVGKWVSYDTTPLDTEARREIQEDKETESFSSLYDQEISKFLDDEVYRRLKFENSEVDGIPVYKIMLEADTELIDHFGKKIEEEQKGNSGSSLNILGASDAKLSEMLKKLRYEVYIDKEKYYIRKVVVSSELEIDTSDYTQLFLGFSPSTSGKSKLAITLAAKFDKFGEEINFMSPSDSINFEEFTDIMSQILSEVYGGLFSSAIDRSTDSRKVSDLIQIQTALEIYRSDCNRYPALLDSLTTPPENCSNSGGKYLYSVPKDPDTDEKYYYKPSQDEKSYDLCAYLDSASPPTYYGGDTNCPDPNYNYHIKNP